ncbi:hypothetical protein FIBSPDRAFT_962481 [Athelia psychrophila]|uniref:F-box domain-containing protein n=1 Tax=Athelia psychrophila TaxID=1759441 RepID=A0A166A1N8_9AGAM|nr:hypothetical protein FIBSPDRAFT_962481 [Fibularhizoctonia sp. CBS 109695]
MAVINILTYIPFQAAPILNSIKVGHNYDETWGPKRPLFQLGAPHLMTADIEGISIPSIPDFLSNLQHLTSLRISVTFNQDIPGATYNKLRDSLMALPSLNHLDLTIHDIFMDMEPRLPIILPTLHFLQLDGDGEGATSIVHSIQADYLIALSLEQWEVIDTEDTFNDRTESQFPSLEHLVLNKDMPDLDAFARSLPKVERLTVGGRCGLIHMCIDTQDDWERWTSLQVLAVGAFDSPTDLMGLPNIISKVKRGGHPIRKLMLPKVVLHLDDVAELRKLVEVEDFSIDLPNPFGKSLTILEDLL